MNARATPPPLHLDRASARYGDRLALADVDLTVRSGEFVALTGPNGAGKTTILRIALGQLPPSGGLVELFGESISATRVRERAKRVAWVPQEESPRDNVPVREYVMFGRYPHLRPLDAEGPVEHRIVERVLEEVGLSDRASDGILDLSGGERQRAVLGRALAQEAPLLLLDEPTSHLDIGHQLDILARVRALSRVRGTTVVAAMHDLNLAAQFADRIVVLSRGRVVADGPPTAVLSEELLARVWGVVSDLRKDPRTGVPYLLPHSLAPATERGTATRGIGRVHVVGGGGAAAPILRALTDAGFEVSTGCLNLLDTDQEVAEALRIETAVEVPFAPLGPEARARNRELLRAARSIVIAPFAVGPSNLSNLEDVLEFVGPTPVLLVDTPAIESRDFSGGAGARAFAELVRAGARRVSSIPELIGALIPRSGPPEAGPTPPPTPASRSPD